MIRVAVPAVLLLTAFSTTAATQSRAPDQATARVERALAGLSAGPPQRCLRRDNYTELRTARNVLVYVAGRDRAWRNDVVGEGCARQLARGDLVVTLGSVGDEHCANDIVQTRSRSGGNITGSCALGEFVPYTRNR